jgi:CHAT domain
VLQRACYRRQRGEVLPTENDGIVTAEEAGGLKLDGTWLVVLSACETGSGEARAGEGAMGLRRGFIPAGAQNLLQTLWPSAMKRRCRSCSIFMTQPSKAATHHKRSLMFRAIGWSNSVRSAGYSTLFGSLDLSS